MKTLAFLAVALIAPVPCIQGQSEPAPVVARVHWITLHARTPEAFDSLYALLSRDLRLPVYFQPEQHGSRRYATVLAGNVILEACGPFPDGPYRGAAVSARWNTLVFRPSQSTAASLARLDGLGIGHGPPRTETWNKDHVDVSVTGLSAPGMPVVLSECVEQEQALRAKLDSLRDELKAGKGGPLGIRHVEEIHVGYSTDDNFSRWRAFLTPIEPIDGVWHLPAAPHLRFVRADRDEIVALVLKVESTARAASRLKALNMLGERQENTVAIGESRTGGLKIWLRE